MQTENEAWQAVLPQVGILKVFFEYATAIGAFCVERARAWAPGG